MITIENEVLILKRFKDDFILINKTDELVEYVLFSIGCNNTITTIETKSLVPTSDIDYLTKGRTTLPIVKDGNYKIDLNGVIVYFSSWKNHRNQLIDIIEKTLCSKCKECNEPTQDCMSKKANNCLRNQSLFNFIQVYNNLVKPFSFDAYIKLNTFLNNFNQTTIDNNSCFIKEELCKQLLDTCIDGKSHTNEDLFNYFISVYYLGLYLYDKSFISTTIFTSLEVQQELVYLKEVYRYDDIKRCILNLGINVDNILEVVTNTESLQVYYWQDSNIQNLLINIFPLIDLAYLASKPVKTFAEFGQGISMALSNIGRIVFVVKKTALTSFIIEDFLGNDITNEFNVNYINSLEAAVFVSKEYQSHGTNNFKFKTLL